MDEEEEVRAAPESVVDVELYKYTGEPLPGSNQQIAKTGRLVELDNI
jgi:hypothetical protein